MSTKDSTFCMHVNKQYINPDGKFEDLFCSLPVGHSGDHFAKGKMNVPQREVDERTGRVLATTMKVVEQDCYWRDSANVSPGSAPELPQMSMGQSEILMAIMNRNPTLTYAQALGAAKADEKWARLAM